MQIYTVRICRLIFVVCLLTTVNVFAQWPDDPALNLVISNEPGEQAIAKVAATSDGGCYVSWYSNSAGNYDMRLQRLDADGNIVWEPNGILISDHPQNSWLTDYDMTVDNEDHAILVFNDIRAGIDWDIYAYRISPTGDFVWGPDGLTISDNVADDVIPKVIITSSGNIVFAWQEDYIIHARKVDMAGNDLWNPATIDITSTYGLYRPYIAPSNDDGFVMQVYLLTGPNYWNPKHIYVYKFDTAGAPLWGSGGVAVSTAGGMDLWRESGIMSDENGGCFSYWYDVRTIHHAYIQHVQYDGAVVWTANGVQLSLAGNELQMNPTIVYLPASSEVLAFYLATDLNQSVFGINGQKLNAAGERQWGDGGVVHVPMSGQAIMYIDASYMSDGAIVTYQESPDGASDVIKAIRVDTEGNLVWDPSPVMMASNPSDKLHKAVGRNYLGQVIVAWGDNRNDAGDIYLQNLNPDGTLGAFVGGGCSYVVGDFNGSGVFNIADIIDSFSKLKTGGPEADLLCECPPGGGNFWAVAMDVNNSCNFNIADVVIAFSKLKTGLPELVPCEQCPPL